LSIDQRAHLVKLESTFVRLGMYFVF